MLYYHHFQMAWNLATSQKIVGGRDFKCKNVQKGYNMCKISYNILSTFTVPQVCDILVRVLCDIVFFSKIVTCHIVRCTNVANALPDSANGQLLNVWGLLIFSS